MPGPRRTRYPRPPRGAVGVKGVRVGARDGAAITDEPRLRITALDDAELVMVDTV